MYHHSMQTSRYELKYIVNETQATTIRDYIRKLGYSNFGFVSDFDIRISDFSSCANFERRISNFVFPSM